jgi:hypothetical protein
LTESSFGRPSEVFVFHQWFDWYGGKLGLYNTKVGNRLVVVGYADGSTGVNRRIAEHNLFGQNDPNWFDKWDNPSIGICFYDPSCGWDSK